MPSDWQAARSRLFFCFCGYVALSELGKKILSKLKAHGFIPSVDKSFFDAIGEAIEEYVAEHTASKRESNNSNGDNGDLNA